MFFVILVSLGVVLYHIENPGVAALGADAVEITVFDVGQGDAILVEAHEGEQMLVDGGPDGTVLSKLGATLPRGDRVIESVVLTHPHVDHLVGLIETMKRYDVRQIIMPELGNPTPEYKVFLEAVHAEDAEVVIARETMDLNIGRVSATLFVPLPPQDVGEPNDASLVIVFRYGSQSIILTGDAEALSEENLIAQGASLDVDVLKVGHHGSKSGTTEAFLRATTPKYAIISVGENSYGHPHAEVLRRLAEFGLRIFRTDQNGDIMIRTDGEHLTVLGER